MAQRKTTLGRGIPKIVRQTERLYTIGLMGERSALKLSLNPRTAKSKLRVSLTQAGIAASRAMKKFGIKDAWQKKELHMIVKAWVTAETMKDEESAKTFLDLVSQKLHGFGFDQKKAGDFMDYFIAGMQRLTMRTMEEIRERRLNRR